MSYGTAVTLDLPYDEAVVRVKDAFKKQGFGTLTEIDVQSTLKEKLDEDVEPYVILQPAACAPRVGR